MPGPGFAVLDFETTGLFPGGHDRVIELAIVHVSSDGRIEGEWETLVNPGRDLGAQRIHGIRAADIVSAPPFEQVAAQFVELLAGRVVVAHNASFDTRFLLAELQRSGQWMSPDLVSLCTMQLAHDFLPCAGRSLADCCAAYDIELVGAHRASVDAAATARLLAAYIESSQGEAFWDEHLANALRYEWPALSAAESTLWLPRPAQAIEVTAESFLERITLKLPEYAGPAGYCDAVTLNYIALLDRCLLDRHLSVHEAQALVQLAEESGIDRTSCQPLHLEYFESLARVAWSDGQLTVHEMADLLDVANLLDIPTDALTAVLDAASAPAPQPLAPEWTASELTLSPGDVIVLTGEMTRAREQWEGELIARGFTPWAAVTKKVSLLVAADPDSLSGKARKARDYGIPIVDEAGLARLLGE